MEDGSEKESEDDNLIILVIMRGDWLLLILTAFYNHFGLSCKYPNLNMKWDIRKIVERK